MPTFTRTENLFWFQVHTCTFMHLYGNNTFLPVKTKYSIRIIISHTYHIAWFIILKRLIFTWILCLFMILLQKLVHSRHLQSACSQILSSLASKVSKDRFLLLPQEYYFTAQFIRLSENIF